MKSLGPNFYFFENFRFSMIFYALFDWVLTQKSQQNHEKQGKSAKYDLGTIQNVNQKWMKNANFQKTKISAKLNDKNY